MGVKKCGCNNPTCNAGEDFTVSCLVRQPDSATRTEVVLVANECASAALGDAKAYCDRKVKDSILALKTELADRERGIREDLVKDAELKYERKRLIRAGVLGNNTIKDNTFTSQSQEEIDAEVARNQARQVDIKASKVVLPGEKPFKCTCPACGAWRAMNDAALLSPLGPIFFDASKVSPFAIDAIKNGRGTGTMDTHEDLERKLAATTRRAEIAESNAANSARASSERALHVASLKAQLDGVLGLNDGLKKRVHAAGEIAYVQKQSLDIAVAENRELVKKAEAWTDEIAGLSKSIAERDARITALQARNDRQAESISKQANKLREMGVEVPLP